MKWGRRQRCILLSRASFKKSLNIEFSATGWHAETYVADRDSYRNSLWRWNRRETQNYIEKTVGRAEKPTISESGYIFPFRYPRPYCERSRMIVVTLTSSVAATVTRDKT